MVSLGLQVDRLGDGAELGRAVGIGLAHHGQRQRLGGQLAVGLEAGVHGRVAQRVRDRLVQRLHDGLGRVLPDEIAGPDVEVEVLELLALGDQRVLPGAVLALLVEHGQHLDLAVLLQAFVHLAVGGQEDVDLAADQVLVGRCRALVGHMDHRDASALGQVFAQDVIEAARSDRGEGDGLAFLGHLARVVEELVDAVDGQVLARQEGDLRGRDHLHQAEVLALELDGRDRQRRQDQLVGRALEQQMPVGRGVERLGRGDGTAGAAQVLDDHGLAELLAQRVVDGARDHVRDAAGRVGHQQRDRLGRKALRHQAAGQPEAGDQGGGALEAEAFAGVHVCLRSDVVDDFILWGAI